MAVPFSFFSMYISSISPEIRSIASLPFDYMALDVALSSYIYSHDGRRFAFLPIENRKIQEIVSFSEIEKLNPSFAGGDGVLVRANR